MLTYTYSIKTKILNKGTKEQPGLLPTVIQRLPKKRPLAVSIFDIRQGHLEDHIARHKQKLFRFRLQECPETGVFSARVKDKKEITFIFKTVFNNRKTSSLGKNHNLVIRLSLSNKKSFNFLDFCGFEDENRPNFEFLRKLLDNRLKGYRDTDPLAKILFQGREGLFRFFLINHLVNVEDNDTILSLIKFLSSG